MPRRFFEHLCRDNRVHAINVSPCHICGAPGVYAGWGFSGMEYMGHYSRLYGIRPIGPHRPFVDGLKLSERCPACDGQGLFDIDQGRDYTSCDVCDGLGQRLTCTPEELKAVQQLAGLIIEHVERFPRSARDGAEPIHQVLGLIADEPVYRAALRFLAEQRLTEVVRILTWQGILDPNDAPASELEEDEDEEEFPLDNDVAPGTGLLEDDPDGGPENRRPGPPSMEDISQLLERMGQLNLLNE